MSITVAGVDRKPQAIIGQHSQREMPFLSVAPLQRLLQMQGLLAVPGFSQAGTAGGVDYLQIVTLIQELTAGTPASFAAIWMSGDLRAARSTGFWSAMRWM